MSISAVTSSVQAAALLATYTFNTKHRTGETADSAMNIGNLEQEGVAIGVTDQGTTDGVQTYNFTVKNSNDNISLVSNFNNVVDKVTTRVQVFDSNGNTIADNQGTSDQQYAYTQLTSTGLTPGAGNYSVVVTPLDGSAGAPQIDLSVLQQQGTSLSVNSSLNTAEPAEYYNFSLVNSNNIKLAFDANANSSATRVQLYDSTGRLIADNRGTAYQKSKFNDLTSGTGLTATSGDYQVKVSYADGVTPTDAGLKYNFQLYSGTNYDVTYQTNAIALTSNSTAASSVTASDKTAAFGQTAYHTLNETAQTGISIGYLKQDKTSLFVSSILTAVDATDYYRFTLQSGNNLKLSLSNVTNPTDTSSVRLQLLDSSGGHVIADNQGSAAQKAAFTQLTSSTGLTERPASYIVKASYSGGANKQKALQYNLQLFSGTTYSARYKTTASAQTYQNALLSGTLGSGSSANTAIASYLNSASNGTIQDVMSVLKTLA